MDIKEIRRVNLLGLIAESEGVIARLARKTGQNPSVLSQIKNGSRDMGHDIARALEEALSHEKGWMDRLQFPTAEEALYANEVLQLAAGMAPEDRDAWLKHGRLLMKNQPPGPNNPYPLAPKPKKPSGGTQ